MASKVAVVELERDIWGSFQQAIDLIGGVDDLNTPDREVAVKVGVFNHKKIFPGHATLDVVDSIIHSFNMALQVYLVESDNYKGTGLERLQVWKEIFTKRIVPFNLSTDNETRQVEIAGEKIYLSHVLFKPNVFISTHVLRRIGRSIGTLNLTGVGSILKNLLGLMPERKKARFHKKLISVLLDAYEAIGGIDLAVLDGTYTYLGVGKTRKQVRTNVLLVGRDAIAVEAVGASLVGLNPHEMPVMQEAMKRNLGEGDLRRIELLGTPIEGLRPRFQTALSTLGLEDKVWSA